MSFRTAGILLLSLGGFLYTLERMVAYFSTYITSIGKEGISVDLTVLYPGFFSNLFIPFFVFLGLIFCVIGFSSKKND
ncbi:MULTISPECIES: hypothetical protein [Paenibacillus]|uniref:hypothetical protein n=1 Tax=Paenibacillus TaxID=44249 RepID=UPI000785A56D|nr:hypothetical protein [Paenibacillus pabuli]MEC0127657.1 hypothetical protein [Paenibacillus pabuli]